MEYPKCPFCPELTRQILQIGESHPYWGKYQLWLAKVAAWEREYLARLDANN